MSELLEKALFWEKYRPSKLDDMILPDSIIKLAETGISGNYLFHSAPGMGKTTLARILLKDYKDGQHIILDGKLGVDELRNKVKSFCTEMIAFADPNKLRVVYFEEFDRATRQLQEELKSFMEDHSERVRFIATCNNVSKIDNAIRSRFTEVDFTTTGEDTVKLKNKYVRRLIDISLNENLNLEKKDLISIVQNRFPDFRKIWQDVQFLHKTGINNSTQSVTEEDEKLFNIIINPTEYNTVKTWEYLYVNWMDKIDSAFTKLGKDYFKFIQTKHSGKINTLGNTIILVSEYGDSKLPTCIDPFITLCALVYKLQELHK